MTKAQEIAVKSAVELIVAGKREYEELYETYGHLMTLLTSPDWESAIHPKIGLDAVAEVFDIDTDNLDLPSVDQLGEPF